MLAHSSGNVMAVMINGNLNERARSLLDVKRLPARVNSEQVAELLGHQLHDIPLLVKGGLLKPLGGGPRNSVKYFAAFEIAELCHDRKWLDRATKAISRRSGSLGKQRQYIYEPLTTTHGR